MTRTPDEIDRWQREQEAAGFVVRRVPGTRCVLADLADHEQAANGDGKTFHFRLTPPTPDAVETVAGWPMSDHARALRMIATGGPGEPLSVDCIAKIEAAADALDAVAALVGGADVVERVRALVARPVVWCGPWESITGRRRLWFNNEAGDLDSLAASVGDAGWLVWTGKGAHGVQRSGPETGADGERACMDTLRSSGVEVRE